MAQIEPLQLTFAGISFVLHEAKAYRMASPKAHEIKEGGLPTLRKYQPLVDLVEELDRILPFKYLQDFSHPNVYSDHQDSLARRWRGSSFPNPSIKLGEWYYPTTASRWSVFRGLATSSQVKEMLKVTGGYRPATFVMQAEPLGPGFVSPHTDPIVRFLTGEIEKPYRLQTEMHMLPPRPLAEHGGQFDGLYLVTLVDERYYWQYSSVTLKITKNTSWNDVINQCQRALSLPVQNIDVDNRYGLGPEADSPFWNDNGNAAVFMDAAAHNVGDTIVRLFQAAAGGQYKFLHALESQTVAKDNRGNATKLARTAGGELFVSGAATKLPVGPTETTRNAVIAEKVSVTFPMYIVGDDPVPHMVNLRNKNPRPSSWHEEPYGGVYAVDVPLSSGNQIFEGNLFGRDPYPNSGLVGTPGATHTISTTSKALFNLEANLSGGASPSDPVNLSGMRFMAMQLAADYWNWQAAEALDESYPGTYHWNPEGFHDILWSWYGSKHQATTRVMRAPWNAVIPEMQNATVPMSGYHNQMAGVGGKTVAQAWRDSQSGFTVETTLKEAMAVDDVTINLTSIDFLPTENRWKAKLSSGGPREETILCEGTSGFYAAPVQVIYRELDRSLAYAHPVGESVIWQFPDTVWNANLVTRGKMSFAFPGEMTSGGINEVVEAPQIQTVRAAWASGELLANVLHFSGEVWTYRTTDSTLLNRENCWLVERSNQGVTTNKFYGGQFAGFSRGVPGGAASGRGVAPVYLVDQATVGDVVVTGDDFSFVKVLHEFPDEEGYYSGQLMTKVGIGGKLTPTVPPQYRWLRDANNFQSLWLDEVYECTKTGTFQKEGDVLRDVFTTKDYDLMLTSQTVLSGNIAGTFAPLMKVGLNPIWCWDYLYTPVTRELQIARVLDVSDERYDPVFENTASLVFTPYFTWNLLGNANDGEVRITRLLNVRREGGDPSVDNVIRITFKPECAWRMNSPSEGFVEIDRRLDIFEGDQLRTESTRTITFDSQDFNVGPDTGLGCDATVETEGVTGTRCLYRYVCEGTNLRELSNSVEVRHGLIKSWPLAYTDGTCTPS